MFSTSFLIFLAGGIACIACHFLIPSCRRWTFPWPLYVLLALIAGQFTPLLLNNLYLFVTLILMILLPHIILLLMIFDAITRRAKRALLVVPIIFYGGYYLVYWRESLTLTSTQAELKALNPKKLMDFDPTKQALLLPPDTTPEMKIFDFWPYEIEEPNKFIVEHEIPIVYREETPPSKGYRAYRGTSNALPEFPSGKPVLITISSAPERKLTTIIRKISIVFNKKTLGVFHTLKARVLPPFPLLKIHCLDYLSQIFSKGRCDAYFQRIPFMPDVMADDVDRTLYDTPVALMLGIKKHGFDTGADYKESPDNGNTHSTPFAHVENTEDDDFARLEIILAGGELDLAFALGQPLVRNPRRLASYAKRMMLRLSALENTAIANAGTGNIIRDERALPLAFALAALSPQDFAPLALRIFALAQHKDFGRDYPALYLRAADAGSQTLDFYKQAFLERRNTGPSRLGVDTLALCRVGVVDPIVVAEMKKRYIAAIGSRPDYSWQYNEQEELFLALMQLGEQDFLMKNDERAEPGFKMLRDAIYAGRGGTANGPNNCMTRYWPEGTRPPIMAPSLTLEEVYMGRSP